MDVDLIFKPRHGVHAGGGGHRGDVLRRRGRDCGAGARARAELRTLGADHRVVVTALLFDPVRKWIQEKLDQFSTDGLRLPRTLIDSYAS